MENLAKELNVKPEEVKEMEMRIAGGDVTFEAPADASEEQTFAPFAYLTDADDEPSRLLEDQEIETKRSEGLEQALSELDPRSRRIIQARWLADEKEQLTLHDLAAEFKVSAERIRQIEVKAMQKMKSALAEFA